MTQPYYSDDYLAVTRCTWCSHPPHGTDCPKAISRGPKLPDTPCPCARHKKETS